MPQILTTRGLSALALALGTTSGAAHAADAPVALIIAQGGLGDQSYNDLAFAGFKRGLAETKLEGKPVESKDVVAQAEDMLRRAADAGFGLIVDLEYSHGETLAKVAAAYPDAKFVILNQTQAAKESGHYAIGVDTDQDGLAQGNVLTSMVKRTDVAVETVVKDYAAGKFPGGGTVTLGLKEDGVGLSDMKYTRDLIPAADLKK